LANQSTYFKTENILIKLLSFGLLRSEYAERIVRCVLEVSGILSVFYGVLLVSVQ